MSAELFERFHICTVIFFFVMVICKIIFPPSHLEHNHKRQYQERKIEQARKKNRTAALHNGTRIYQYHPSEGATDNASW
jgi:hypothetical protein